MNNKIVIFVLAVVLLVGGIIFLLPSDEKKIRDNLDSLAQYCSTLKSESVIETLQKVTSAAKLFTVPCKVYIETYQIDREFDQKDLTDRFLMMKKRLANTTFIFEDAAVEVTSDDRAIVLTTLRLDGQAVEGRFTDAYEMNITVEKHDGDWLFSSFTVVEFMKK